MNAKESYDWAVHGIVPSESSQEADRKRLIDIVNQSREVNIQIPEAWISKADYASALIEEGDDDLISIDSEDGDGYIDTLIDAVVTGKIENVGGSDFVLPVPGAATVALIPATSIAALSGLSKVLAPIIQGLFKGSQRNMLWDLIKGALGGLTLIQVGDLLGEIFPSLMLGTSQGDRVGIYYRHKLIVVAHGPVHIVMRKGTYLRNLDYQAGRLEFV